MQLGQHRSFASFKRLVQVQGLDYPDNTVSAAGAGLVNVVTLRPVGWQVGSRLEGVLWWGRGVAARAAV